jgi:hypothetical protein
MPPLCMRSCTIRHNRGCTSLSNLEAGTNEAYSVSARLWNWANIHHVQPGSARVHCLIMLKSELYDMNAQEERGHGTTYVKVADSDIGRQLILKNQPQPEWASYFDRIPPQPQMFDLLVWAHRSHNSASSMLKECQRAGFVSHRSRSCRISHADHHLQATITWPIAEIFTRLCPTCGSDC